VLPDIARDIVLRHVVECPLYDLHEAVVMPDHVHLVATPNWDREGSNIAIGEILRKIKGASAREVNLALGRRGALWQSESFDHELRRDESSSKSANTSATTPSAKAWSRAPRSTHGSGRDRAKRRAGFSLPGFPPPPTGGTG
jgi:REP element-mobilizing transposase RayT